MRTSFWILISLTLFLNYLPEARAGHVIVEPETLMIDGTSPAFKDLKPGDTVFFRGGERKYLMIRNFTGQPGKPFYFMNYNGTVLINTDWYYGIVLQTCRYVRLSGTGDEKYFYGFMITRVKGGAGISVGTLSSDFELDHIYISNVPIAGIYAKTDPDCSFTSTRDKFIQSNTVIHDCYVSNVGNEGMYIGSSFYNGENVKCGGRDTLVYPGILVGVKIYNNIVKYTGWDGIQVSSASENCQIYNNLVEYDSQAGVESQMSGILIGGGSQCDCYNNYIYKGKGDGIESLGLGNYRIFNNIIVDAGRGYYPDDPSRQKHGIYLGDVSTKLNSSIHILFNDIINPKSTGIRFASVVSRNNLVASNVIINPGRGSDSYIVTEPAGSVIQKNNYKAMNAESAGFRDTLYSLKPGSPLINAGFADSKGVTFDYSNRQRRTGAAVDIGAQEFSTLPDAPLKADLQQPSVGRQLVIDPVTFVNPTNQTVTIRFRLDTVAGIGLDVYNMEGTRVYFDQQQDLTAGDHQVVVDTKAFPMGIYIYSIHLQQHKSNPPQVFSGRFYKVK